MSDCIVLCEIRDSIRKSKYKISNEFTKHAKRRSNRLEVVSRYAKPAYYFELYRVRDSSKQIHCILEDATLLVFNKDSHKLITIIIANRKTLNKYFNKIDNNTDTFELIYNCALINEDYLADKINKNFTLEKEVVKEIKCKKKELLDKLHTSDIYNSD